MTSGSSDCVITANAPANSTYSAAAPVSVTVAAKKLTQAPLVLTVPTTGRVGDAGLTATTTGGSGTGATTYATTTPSICSVNATTGAITAIAAGTCSITVTKAGDTNYDPTSATKTLTVTPAVAATSLNLVTAPAGGASGRAFTTQPSVEVKDSYGNRMSVSGTMTATLTSGTGSLVGTVTVNVVNGLATWTTLGVSGAGNYTLTFSYNALSVSAPVVVISAYGVAFFDEPIRPTRLNIQQGGQTIPVKIWVPGAPASPTVIRSISNAAEACVNLPKLRTTENSPGDVRAITKGAPCEAPSILPYRPAVNDGPEATSGDPARARSRSGPCRATCRCRHRPARDHGSSCTVRGT